MPAVLAKRANKTGAGAVIGTLLGRLQGVKTERRGEQWQAKCPAHEDHKPSLSIGLGENGKLLIHCQAGCETRDVLKSVGMSESDLFSEDKIHAKPTISKVYSYRDESGAVLYEVVRLEPKGFRQRRPVADGKYNWSLGDVRRVLYRLPELVSAKEGEPIYVVEGEKDADALADIGLVATCCVGGAGKEKWARTSDLARKVLAGRRVYVVPDNDDAGMDHARAVLESLGDVCDCRVLELPNLPKKGDVSDYLAACPDSLTQVEWLAEATAKALSPLEWAGRSDNSDAAVYECLSIEDALAGERDERLSNAKRIVPYQHAYLDDHLGGILPHDLVIVTARTGEGKTALTAQIAESSAEAGHRVLFFALEAERREIAQRMLWRAVADYLVTELNPHLVRNRKPPVPVSRRYWLLGKLDEYTAQMEPAAAKLLSKRLGGRLRTIWRKASGFYLDNLEGAIRRYVSDTDLFVIDHLDYVETKEDSEIASVRRIMDTLRDLAVCYGKPIVLVSHVRKDQGFGRRSLVPSISDVYGSSHVGKKSPIVISLGVGEPSPNWNMSSTYIQVLKDRVDGYSPLVAKIDYDRGAATYATEYRLGKVTRDNKGNETVWEELERDRIPWWAHRAIRTSAVPQKPEEGDLRW